MDDLRQRHVPLDMSPDDFRRAGHDLVDGIARFLEQLRELPVNRDIGPQDVRALLPQGGLPEEGAAAGELLDQATRTLVENSLFNGHPRFLGYITSSAAPIGALADLLAAAVNPNVGGWQLSPVASEIEKQCIAWIAEMLGLPAGSGGILVSGGNMANFVAFLAARRAQAGESIREKGIASGGTLLAYASEETHTWLQKAADLFGHGTDSLRWIPVDGRRRMNLEALQAQIRTDRAAGHRPFFLCGTAGTVGTGAVDPLPEMTALARREGLWMHVDGAYGAFAVLAEDVPADLRALSEADSVAVDPHKWLYAPLEAGCTLVRRPESLSDAFSYTPSYYRFTGEDEDPRTNFYENGMQNSRGFRALKVWLALRQAGRRGYARMIGDDIRLAQELHRLVERAPDLEAVSCNLSIVCFRYVPEDLGDPGGAQREAYLSELNEEILRRLKASGELFVSNAVLAERFLLRACVVNFRTSLGDVEAIPKIVRRHGRLADRQTRPPALRATGDQ